MDFGLKEKDLRKITTVMNHFPQIESAIIYGSRAKGNYKQASDIDIALQGLELNFSLQQQIAAELDDLLLPYKIDLSLLNTISNQELLKEINNSGIAFYVNRSFQKV
jgi:predicted nucleotidyltransferase